MLAIKISNKSSESVPNKKIPINKTLNKETKLTIIEVLSIEPILKRE